VFCRYHFNEQERPGTEGDAPALLPAQRPAAARFAWDVPFWPTPRPLLLVQNVTLGGPRPFSCARFPLELASVQNRPDTGKEKHGPDRDWPKRGS